ncbi:MAG: hypothetical protein V4547_11295 [Bacteroidota bacterium]
MKEKSIIIFSVVVLLMINTLGFSQTNATPSRSDTKTLLWLYSATDQYSGPMDASVTLEYYFLRESIGDKTFLSVSIHYKSMTYTPNFGGYRYKLHNKLYKQDELQSFDSRGVDCFTDVILTRVSIGNLSVDGFSKKFGYNGSIHRFDQIGEISRTKNLNDYSLNVVLSTCSSIGWNDGNCVSERINNFEKGVKNKSEYKNAILKADQAFQLKDWAQARQYYRQASTIFPNENYPKDQLERIKDTEEDLATAKNNNNLTAGNATGSNANSPNQNQSTNNTANKAGGQGGNSNTNKGSGNFTNDNSQTGSSANSNSQTGSYTNSNSQTGTSTNNNNQSGEITNMSDPIGLGNRTESIQVYQQNGKYYAKNSNGSITQTTKQYFDDVHKTVASNKQIEIDNAKLRNDPLAGYTNQPNNWGNINPMTSTNSNSSNLNSFTQGLERGQQISNALSPAINQWADNINANREREAQAQMQREEAQARRDEENRRREAAAAEIRANKLRLVNNRKSLIAKYRDGVTPLSSQTKGAAEVYFFVYSYEASTLENNNPIIYISNVFSVAKYADGTWPFKTSLMESISKTNKGLNLILSGFYLSQSVADQNQQYFVNNANSYGFAINNITYSGKKSSASTGANTDYWGNPTKESVKQPNEEINTIPEQKTSKVELDFWGNPIKKEAQQPNSETQIKQEPVSPKAKVDFWGNPIKE